MEKNDKEKIVKISDRLINKKIKEDVKYVKK